MTFVDICVALCVGCGHALLEGFLLSGRVGSAAVVACLSGEGIWVVI